MPNLHAAILHLPIGLLTTAGLVDLLSWLAPRIGPRPRLGTQLHVAGTLALVATYLSGRAAATHLTIPDQAAAVVLAHWNLALAVTVYFVVLTMARVVTTRRAAGWGRSVHALFTVGAVAGLAGLYLAADRGGELVYRWGVGVTLP